MIVNRKIKKIEFTVNQNKIDTKYHYQEKIKPQEERQNRSCNKICGESKRSICDPQYLKAELRNIEETFEKYGYSKKEVRIAMKTRDKIPREKETTRVVVSIDFKSLLVFEKNA